MLRKSIYWLVGDRSARIMLGGWNYLWGLPLESGGKIAVEIAEESLHSMQESVIRLTESVAKVKAAYELAKEKYEGKKREFQQAEHQALLAHRNGNVAASRLAMSKAILIEQLLPQLEKQVMQAEGWLLNLKDMLREEQQKFETYKIQAQNLEALSEVNEALATITKINTDLRIDSARSQFETAESAVKKRYHTISALAELSEQPTAKLTKELDRLTLNDEITQRLNCLEGREKK
jgi:phage shock protein A